MDEVLVWCHCPDCGAEWKQLQSEEPVCGDCGGHGWIDCEAE